MVGVVVATAAGAGNAEEPPERRHFYFGYDYGTQALYNPLYVLVNRGFDVYQLRANDRSPFEQEYRHNAANVFDNLVHPFSAVSEHGTGRFFTEEVFPLSFKRETARWVPNYSLHLLGGGLTYSALREWYDAHGYPVPGLLSAATNLAAAIINETLENKDVQGLNTDAIADFYFFDIGGMLLFSIDGVNDFFSNELILADWSLQPALTLPSGNIENQGQNFSAKWPLPFYNRLRLFTYFGLVTLGGVSLLGDNGYSVSAAYGARSSRLINLEHRESRNTVDWVPAAGLFVDKNNSLLAAFEVSDVEDYFLSMNLYPGAIKGLPPFVGLWTVVGKHGDAFIGVSSTYTFGMGTGYSHRTSE